MISCENAGVASRIDESARCVYPLACIVHKGRFGFDAPVWSLELISVRGEKHKASSSVVKAIFPSAIVIFSVVPSFSPLLFTKYVPCLHKHLPMSIWLRILSENMTAGPVFHLSFYPTDFPFVGAKSFVLECKSDFKKYILLLHNLRNWTHYLTIANVMLYWHNIW